MAIYIQELKQGKKTMAIWSIAIGVFIMLCVWMYPEMQSQMKDINDMFSSMGSFTVAFGMDQLNFGTLSGFYGVEAGNILGIGGAMYAAIAGIMILSKEEKEHTAEFLMTHPVSRIRVLTEKLLSAWTQVLLTNIVILLLCVLSLVTISVEKDWKIILFFHLAYLLMQFEICSICFGISAFLKSSGMGIGLGISIAFYAFNLIGNISDKVEFLKYITPFSYTESADIINKGGINQKYFLLGMVYGVVAIIIGYLKYSKKDIG